MKYILMSFLLLASPLTHAADVIRLKAGLMPILPYIEMMSDQLKIVVNATDLQGRHFNDVQVEDVQLSWDEALNQMVSNLYLRDLTLIHNSTLDTYQVMLARDARDREIPVITDLSKIPHNQMMVTAIFPVKNNFPEAVTRALRSFAPANSRIIPLYSHLLMITDSANSMFKYQSLIDKIYNEKGEEEYREDMKRWKDKNKCPELPGAMGTPNGTLIFGLVALVGILLGFVIRGYVIRRIEGGL